MRELGISGMQATEWLRAHCRVDIGSCRISAQITHADNDRTENLLIDSCTVTSSTPTLKVGRSF